MEKLFKIETPGGHEEYMFFCPGCRMHHTFIVRWGLGELAEQRIRRNGGQAPQWTFDGDMENPTFSPSLLYPDIGCHLFLKKGQLEFLSDCKHHLAGKTVALEPMP